jgi:SAM-dependent methyltransferase
MLKFDKYHFYEQSVQSPEANVEQFHAIFQELFNRDGHILREDFCGTFRICCEWVKLDPKNIAFGLDLDPEPLEYGMRKHFKKLKRAEQQRLRVFRQNVMTETSFKADQVVACNFSYQVFKERQTLIRYFRSALKSLKKEGILFLDLAGGPGMIEPTKEKTPIYGNNKKRLWSYVWDQKSFDPITHDAHYAIHFDLLDGTRKKDVFTYDWRLWTIPELRDCLIEAGFDDVAVYWETEHKGRGTGEYVRMAKGTNDYSWISYIVGIKGRKQPPARPEKGK